MIGCVDDQRSPFFWVDAWVGAMQSPDLHHVWWTITAPRLRHEVVADFIALYPSSADEAADLESDAPVSESWAEVAAFGVSRFTDRAPSGNYWHYSTEMDDGSWLVRLGSPTEAYAYVVTLVDDERAWVDVLEDVPPLTAAEQNAVSDPMDWKNRLN